MENKVGIVTWMGFHNFGTFLQAYAMRKVLQKHGFDGRFVDDSILSARYVHERFSHRNFFMRNVSRFCNFVFPKTLRSVSYRRYREQHLKIKSLFDDFRSRHLPFLGSQDDPRFFIAGSDQIWAPQFPIAEWYFRHYFLADVDGVKIAYAPSLGMAPEKEEEYIALVSPWLAGFKAVSAREPGGARILSDAVGHFVPTLIDPTLLLDKKDWLKLMEKEYDSDGEPYCLCYLLSYNPDILAQAAAYAEENGLRLVVILNSPQLIADGYTTISVGPSGFLHALYHSRALITDSFHGAIFSTIFEKPSAIYRRFPENESNRQNGRIENFFYTIGSKKRLLAPGEPLTPDVVTTEDPAWTKHIGRERKKSLEFLFNNLKK